MPGARPIYAGRILIVVLICIVIVAGVGAWWLVKSQGKGPGIPPVRNDGSTFHQVLASVNVSVANERGGPWALFSVYGIAAETKFSPNLIGYVHTNVTVNSCGQAFDGLTLWNGTLPLFNGTFNSGTAPFWQLAYFSNSSQEILVVTDVLGQTHIYPPVAYLSPCMPWYDFSGNPASWITSADLSGVDSSAAAPVAWNAVLGVSAAAGDWISGQGPETEIFTLGPGMFMGLGDVASAYGIYLDRCGEVGVAGSQPLILTGVGTSGQLLGVSNLTHNCALVNSGHGAYDSEYDLLFSTPSISSNPSAEWLTAGFQVAIALPNGTLGSFYDEVGLANWMTSWNLTTASGQYLPVGTAGCQSWVPSLSDCPANDTGWYAVLLSASGGWLDSYGARSNGTVGWSEPVTALVSHQQLVVVCPSTWNVTGDQLNVTSTVATSSVIGSLTL